MSKVVGFVEVTVTGPRTSVSTVTASWSMMRDSQPNASAAALFPGRGQQTHLSGRRAGRPKAAPSWRASQIIAKLSGCSRKPHETSRDLTDPLVQLSIRDTAARTSPSASSASQTSARSKGSQCLVFPSLGQAPSSGHFHELWRLAPGVS